MADQAPTPHDILGIMQRRLFDLHAYLSNPVDKIDVEMCKHHLAPVWGMLEKLGEMQGGAEPANGEARPQ